MSKLEAPGYIEVAKEFKGKKPHTMLKITGEGRSALRNYQESMQRVLNNIQK